MLRDFIIQFPLYLFSKVNTLEKQAKSEQKRSFQPSWQLKRPWFSTVPGFCVSTDYHNYGHDALGDRSHEIHVVKKETPFYMLCICYSSLLSGK